MSVFARRTHDVFWYQRGFNLQAVRKGLWKYHLDSKQLYNLDDGIGESSDVAADHPDIVSSFQPLIEKMDADLGNGPALGPGVRPLGEVANPRPLIGHDGTNRPGFERWTIRPTEARYFLPSRGTSN